MKALTLLMLFASFLALVTGQDTLELTVGREGNVVVLRCRRSNGGIPGDPVFETTSGTVLQGDFDQTGLAEGELRVTITEHSTVLCKDNDAQSNTLRIPVFPSGPPPGEELYVFRGDTEELKCNILNPPPEDFRDLYTLNQWIRKLQGGGRQFITLQSAPDRIDPETFALTVSVGEDIQDGESYQCDVDIAFSSNGGGPHPASGAKITIRIAEPTPTTISTDSTEPTPTTISTDSTEPTPTTIFSSTEPTPTTISSSTVPTPTISTDSTSKNNNTNPIIWIDAVVVAVVVAVVSLVIIVIVSILLCVVVVCYIRRDRENYELKQQENELRERPAEGGQQQQPQGARDIPLITQPPPDYDVAMSYPQLVVELVVEPELHLLQSLALQPYSIEHSDQVEDATEEYLPPDYATTMSYPLAVVKASRANGECNTVSELVEPEPPEAPQSRSLTLQPALNETQGSITESLVHSGIPEEHPPLDYVTAMGHPTVTEVSGTLENRINSDYNTAFSLSIPVLPDIQLQSPTRQPNYSETERNCTGPLISQPENTLSTNSLSCFESEQHTPDLHASTSAHHEDVMEEDVHTATEENRDCLSDRQVETELGATSITILQSTDQSISAPTSPDFVCTKPDCPCQRDRCSYHDCLVSEIESQHKTYVDYGQLSNNTDMPDSPNHAQQKLALAKSVRIRKSDSARNQSSLQSNLQIIDKLNPSVPFMDGIDVIECDSLGGHYYNPTCDFVLEIPGGAVPEGTTVQIEMGVTLYGPFQFPENARPISPIVWLCVRQPQPEGFEFLKPVEVTLPHYLDLTDGGEENLELGFLKADHSLNQNKKYQFEEVQDGKATFQPEYGVIHTDHFCYLCLKARSGLHLTSRSLFCLHRIVPKPVTTTAWDIIFCVTFSMRLCLESVKRQYPPQLGYKIVSNRFKFKTRRDASEPKLKIHFSPRPPGGWQLVLESEGSEITPSEVEFWNKEMEEMEWMHMTKEYPPKLTIEVSGEMAVAKSAVEVTFTGIDDQYLGKVNTTISLLHPQQQGHMNSDELSLAIPRVLSCPGIVMSNTMNQLRGVHPIPFNGAATTQPLALMYNPDGSPLSLHNQAEDESQLGLRHASVSSGFASISSLTASSDIGGFHSLPRDIISTGCYSHPALQEEPELRELMNEVAAKVPDKWKDVGIQLGLNIGTLNGISVSNPANPKHCLCEVFSEWRKQGSSPYTWSTVVQALEAEAVGEYQLSQDLTSRLIAKYGND